MTSSSRTLEAVLRDDLDAFIRKTFNQVDPGTPYRENWHIEAIAHHLAMCAKGELKRLIITLPPRHLKSICASVAFPAWLLGRDPACNVVCVSYSNDLAAKHARDCRSVIEAPWYRKTFRGTRISPRKNTETELVTTRNGGRYATSVEGTLTGRGGNVIIIDDPIKPDSAMSETERERVNDWFQRVAYTRLNDRSQGVIIIVMQRVHEDDLVGHVLELDDWTVLEIPAIAEEPKPYRIGDDPGDVYLRPGGEPIDPDREGAEDLAKIKRMMGGFNFAAQYQQAPIPVEGNLVKREWFRSYAKRPARQDMDAVVLSWDTAGVADEMNDYSVCTIWGVVGENYYLIDVVRQQLDYPDLKRTALRLVREHDADIVLVEKAGTGIPLAQELKRQLGMPVWALPARGDKEIRFAAQSAVIEQGRVWLPDSAPWLDAFIRELLGFPGTRHDDQVDSVELFLRFVTGRRGRTLVRGRNGGRERRNLVRRDGRRSTRFDARRYLDDKLRPPSDRLSLF